jgi:transcription elongation factor Elf1
MDLVRKLMCPHCRKYEWHDSTIHADKERNVCRNCEWSWEVDYKKPSKLYDQLVQVNINRVRDAVNSGLSRITNHIWSRTMVTKDKNEIEKLQMDLEYALRLLDTFTGD